MAAIKAVNRHAQKELTRGRLVNAATALFAAKGIVNTTTADVAKAVRMSHGVVFLHFPKRDDLVIAVIDEFGRRLSAELRNAFEQDLGLRSVLKAHLRVLQEFEPFYSRLVSEAAMLPAKVRSTLMLLHAAVSYELFSALERERKAGRARKLERPLLFNTWIGLVHHYLINRDVFSTGDSVIAEHGEMLVNHFMNLLKP
ncbi:MAG: TetR/AcrR family transcriptional regulator [Deltaproteobacteria bacterium]|nr:TetR/AcrR family transcriptional regulator [Deltaproteobacteria bacterium]MBV8452454.1 TetR/AcrR family transcriptional regulator [Deltaproteobacteria bacterium]